MLPYRTELISPFYTSYNSRYDSSSLRYEPWCVIIEQTVCDAHNVYHQIVISMSVASRKSLCNDVIVEAHVPDRRSCFCTVRCYRSHRTAWLLERGNLTYSKESQVVESVVERATPISSSCAAGFIKSLTTGGNLRQCST
jgi:hypothetical protein